MFNAINTPAHVIANVQSKIIDLFMDYCDSFYAEFAPIDYDSETRHLRLVVNREDGNPMTPADIMDLHQLITVACYHDPYLKDVIDFDDFYYKQGEPMTILSLGFDIL